MAGARRVVKMEKPRALKLNLGDQSLESVLSEMDLVSQKLNASSYDHSLYRAITSLCENLRMFGHQLESVYKDQLDKCYGSLRNGCRDDRLPLASRYRLLEVIELRAMHWQPNENLINYYKQKLAQIEAEEATFDDQQQTEMPTYITAGALLTPTNAITTPVFPVQYPAPYQTQPIIYASPSQLAAQHQQQVIAQNNVPGTPPVLGPGEIIKNSGKFSKPMRIPGKNYCKDEIVIRNADSGKVMGLKGRRVHMIEELSETIISFQRVAPGARERLVQITGPTEENINHAKQLIEETIRRNASPVRCEDRDTIFTSLGGSSSSISSHASDDPLQGTKRIGGGVSVDETLGEYRYTVVHENDAIRITGNNLDLVRTAKLILDEYFNGENNLNAGHSSSSDSEQMTTAVTPPKSASPQIVSPRGRSPATEIPESRSPKPQSNSDQIPEEAASTKGSVFTVVRQPLIPSSSKEVIESVESGCPETTNPNVKNRRLLFAKTSEERSNQQAISSADESDCLSTPSSSVTLARITYTREFLVQCASSPLCRLTPAEWALVARHCPHIVKKGWQHLPELLAKMNKNGDSSVNSSATYLQETDCIRPKDLQTAEHQWSLLRTFSVMEDDDNNGNSNGSTPS